MVNEKAVNTLIRDYSIKKMFYKAVYSSTVGFPISMALNAVLIHWIAYVATEYPWLYASIVIGIPYYIASISRQFIIDYVYQKWGVMVDPKHLIEKFYYIIREELDL